MDNVRECVERGEFTFGDEPRTIVVKIKGEKFNVRGWDSIYPVPAVPLVDLDLPSRDLIEFEHDPLKLEFIRLERVVRDRGQGE